MFFVLSMLTASAQAADWEPHGMVQLALSQWRLGTNLQAQYGARASLWEEEGNILREGTGIDAVADVLANPAFVRTGGKLQVTPLAIADLYAYGHASYYFGTFSTLVSYDQADADYGDDQGINQYVEDTGRRDAGTGWDLGTGLTLKAKAGPMILLHNSDYSVWNIGNPGLEGDYFFERDREVMMAFGGDQLLQMNSLVLYEHEGESSQLRAGVINTWRRSFQAEDQLLRVGPLIQWLQGDWKHTLLCQAYLDDRSMPLFPPFLALATQRDF